MLKGKCIECSGKKATFSFEGKQPKQGEYYHFEEQTGKSLELNGLFHAIIPEFYYWMFNRDQFVFDDGGIEIDLRCSSKWHLKDVLKQVYGEGNVYKYVDDKFSMVSQKDFYKIPQYVVDDFNNGNKNRIELKLKSWRDYNEEQASRLVDIIIKLMDKLGVDTPKYKNIRDYLDKKAIENIANKFDGKVVSKR